MKLFNDEKTTTQKYSVDKQRLSLACQSLLLLLPSDIIRIVTSFIPCYWKEYDTAKSVYNKLSSNVPTRTYHNIFTGQQYTEFGWYYLKSQLHWPSHLDVDLYDEMYMLTWLSETILTPGGCKLVDQNLRAINQCSQYHVDIKNGEVHIICEFVYYCDDNNNWKVPLGITTPVFHHPYTYRSCNM